MLETPEREFTLDCPPFMATLGLLPPYELADVKAAYRNKALLAHPDRGGDPAEFMQLKEAYDHAVEYATFRGSRRAWIAANVERYVLQEEVIAEVLRRGGRVEVQRFPWMEKSWGDGFPHLAERLRQIYVRDLRDGDRFLAFLAERRPPYLVGLDLAGSRISSNGWHHLRGYEIMHSLNLSDTDINSRALGALLHHLPSLEWLNVRKTRLGWWGRWRLRRGHPQLRIVSEVSPIIEPGEVTKDVGRSDENHE